MTDEKPMTVDALMKLAQQFALAHFNPSLASTTLDEYRRSFRAAIEQYGQEREAAGCGSGEPVAEHGQLHPDRARDSARKAILFANSLGGVPRGTMEAEALDWITELGAMVLNLADRVAPQPREPLTEEQIDSAIAEHVDPVATYGRLVAFARAIERAHGIRSEG